MALACAVAAAVLSGASAVPMTRGARGAKAIAPVPGQPEQGYSGPHVLHKNKSSIAMDWGHEYPHIDGYIHGGAYGPHGDTHAHPYGTHPWHDSGNLAGSGAHRANGTGAG